LVFNKMIFKKLIFNVSDAEDGDRRRRELASGQKKMEARKPKR